MRRFLPRTAMVMAAMSAAACVFAVLPSPAQAGETELLLKNRATGRCLDSNSQGAVYTLPCQKGNGYQTWIMNGTFNEQASFRNQATGKCLDMWFDGSRPVLTVGECRSFNNFRPTPSAEPGKFLVEISAQFLEMRERVCVDSDHEGHAYALECNSGGYQKWELID